MSKLVPKLRFKGFSGEWEEKKLGEQCFTISSGKTKASKDGEINVYGSTGIIGKTNMHTHNGNYILVARVGANAGLINYVNGKFSVTDNTLIIDLNKDKVIPQFLMPLLHRYNLNRLVFGSGQPLITGKQLKDLTLYFPKLKEQQKIANCLSSLDSLIEAQNKKVETLKEHKKGLMQQLFPSESETVPKLRFDGFSGEWVENKVTIKIVSGNNYPLDSYDKQGTLLVQGLNITPNKLMLDKPIYISSSYKIDNHIIIKKDDILIGLNRPVIDNKLKICLFNEEEAYLYQRAGILEFDKNKLSNLFLYYYLSSYVFLKQLLLELVGSDQPYIKSDLFQKTKNIFPKDKDEQEKIANFLSSLDNLIEVQNKKVETLKEHKKGLMQQLFVSSEG